MDYNDVSFKAVPTDDECVVNAVQIGKMIDEPPHTIRSWANEFEDYLYIKKMNGRFLYTQKSVEQFEFIKTLRREKNFSIEQIRQQLKLTGYNYNPKENGLVNSNDVNFIESISADISIKLKNELGNFIAEMFAKQNDLTKEHISKIQTNIEQTVQDQLENSEKKINETLNEKIANQTEKIQEDIKNNNQELLKEINEQKEQNKKLLEYMDSIQKEVAVTKDLNEKMDYMKNAMEERKKENQLAVNTEKQSFWSKFFKK